MCQKTPTYESKETFRYVKIDMCFAGSQPSPSRTLQCVQNLYMRQKRPMHVSKETYSLVKRNLYIDQKRRIDVSKETYVCVKRHQARTRLLPGRYSVFKTNTCVKRDLCMCQKRHIYESNETHISAKRDICMCPKTPVFAGSHPSPSRTL